MMDVRAMVGNNRLIAISEVERGETAIKAEFEKAMTSDNISATVKNLITMAYRDSIGIGYDQAAMLKVAAA